jgi:hypothetical protein
MPGVVMLNVVMLVVVVPSQSSFIFLNHLNMALKPIIGLCKESSLKGMAMHNTVNLLVLKSLVYLVLRQSA